MWTVPRVLEDCITRACRLWRTQLASRPRRRPTRRRASPAPLSAQTVAGWLVWADILLDVIGGVESALRDSTNALHRINIGADVWGESSIMTGVY